MAFIPVPDVAQVAIRFTRDAQQVENVIYVHSESGWDPGKLQQLADDVATQVSGAGGYLGECASNVIFQGVHVRDLTSDTGLSVDSGIGSGTAGGNVGIPMPNNVTIAVHKNAVIGGRHNKGRLYWPGLSVTQLNGSNAVSTAFMAAAVIRLENLGAAIESVPDRFLGFVSYVENGVPLPTGVFIPQGGWQFRDPTLDSQRRRLPGRGS